MLIFVNNGRTMMISHNFILLFIICVTNTWAHGKVDLESNDLKEGDIEVKFLDNNNVYLTLFKNNLRSPEKVHIQLYYESLCPDSIEFEVNKFAPVVKTMNWYLDIKTYPFGFAKMVDHNGKLEFKCQHGAAECYGNKLHACALDKLQCTSALLYNACLMNSTENSGSDDESAERCGKSMNIDSEQIKECAKGSKGIELLRYYGEESKKANILYVPYVLINGVVFEGDDFKKAVCDAFSIPPPVCQ